MKLNNILLSIPLVCTLSLGCSNEKSVSEPPRTRAELVVALFRNIEKKDHEISLKKIEKLRQIDPSNIFLASLEIKERNNLICSKIQNLLDKNQLDKAYEEINDALSKYGIDNYLMKIKKEIETLIEIEKNLNTFNNEFSDSSDIAGSAAILKDISDKYPPANMIKPIASEKLILAKKLFKWENSRAMESMICDYLHTLETNTQISQIIISQIMTEKNTNSQNYCEHHKKFIENIILSSRKEATP